MVNSWLLYNSLTMNVGHNWEYEYNGFHCDVAICQQFQQFPNSETLSQRLLQLVEPKYLHKLKISRSGIQFFLQQ